MADRYNEDSHRVNLVARRGPTGLGQLCARTVHDGGAKGAGQPGTQTVGQVNLSVQVGVQAWRRRPRPSASWRLGLGPGCRRLHELSPAALQAALEADPVSAREHLERLEFEVQRVVKRLAAANRASAAASERTEAFAS